MKTKIIDLAKKQIGNDWKIYCKDMGYNYRIEWCACFISWLATKLSITDIIPVDMSCNNQISFFAKRDDWHTDIENIQAGDIIYYDWDRLGDSRPADHVGIVESVKNGVITVIEGNKNDRVEYRKAKIDNPLIFGFARPKYKENTAIQQDKEVFSKLPTLRRNYRNDLVKMLQTLLVLNGYSVGSYGIDGDFGTSTELSVKAFQTDMCIEIDGIVGKNTWSKLLRKI